MSLLVTEDDDREVSFTAIDALVFLVSLPAVTVLLWWDGRKFKRTK